MIQDSGSSVRSRSPLQGGATLCVVLVSLNCCFVMSTYKIVMKKLLCRHYKIKMHMVISRALYRERIGVLRHMQRIPVIYVTAQMC